MLRGFILFIFILFSEPCEDFSDSSSLGFRIAIPSMGCGVSESVDGEFTDRNSNFTPASIVTSADGDLTTKIELRLPAGHRPPLFYSSRQFHLAAPVGRSPGRNFFRTGVALERIRRSARTPSVNFRSNKLFSRSRQKIPV